MTPRQRVEAALRREPVDFVPFTIYESKLPMCAVERRMRNDGLCIVERRTAAVRARRSGITSDSETYVENGHALTRVVYHTPKGDLTTVREPVGFTTWTHEHLFKGPDDYEPLLALIESESYEPNYEAFEATRARWGDDAFVRASLPNAPIQTLISGHMGTLTFGLEMMDRPADVERLLDALTVQCRRHYELLAESPVVAINYGGNHSPSILGRQRFIDHILPHWEEACSVLQPAGKLVGCHMDDNNRLWADLIAGSKLDYIEAFSPSPDCDMTVAEARAAWPDKVLWINFPSSVHLRSNDEVRQVAEQILDEAGDGTGFLMGVTEDVHDERWPETYPILLQACRDHGAITRGR